MTNSPLTAAGLAGQLKALADPVRASQSLRFFRTAPGDYGAGDRFLGIRMPVLRKLARTQRDLPLDEAFRLLTNPWHEARLLALLILVEQFRHGDRRVRDTVARGYLQHTAYINNWDLVDCSAHLIIGPWLEGRSHRRLFTLIRSSALWERRIALISTLHFIRGGDMTPTLALAAQVLDDEEDLIHKAGGWMLREVGRRDRPGLLVFLDQHAAQMPRTMLRYAIEHLPAAQRQNYLKRRARP